MFLGGIVLSLLCIIRIIQYEIISIGLFTETSDNEKNHHKIALFSLVSIYPWYSKTCILINIVRIVTFVCNTYYTYYMHTITAIVVLAASEYIVFFLSNE